VAITILVTDITEFAQGENVQDPLGAGLYCPDLITVCGHVPQHPGARVVVPLPLAEILHHHGVHVLEAVWATRLYRLAHLLSHQFSPL
jgi:hypothetical protein